MTGVLKEHKELMATPEARKRLGRKDATRDLRRSMALLMPSFQTSRLQNHET